MDRLDYLLSLLNDNCQLIINKDGSGRIDEIETGEPFIFFDNINDIILEIYLHPNMIK